MSRCKCKGKSKKKPEKIRIPAFLPINNLIFQIQKVDGLSEKQSAAGMTLWRDRILALDSKLEGQELLETILHEIMHGHQFASGLFEVLERQALEMHTEGLTQFLLSIFDIKFKDELFDEGEL